MKAKKPKSPKNPAAGPAQALLDAHVDFLVEELSGKGLQPLIESLLSFALEQAEGLVLEDVVTRDMIKATARTYAIELDMQGGIPELIGEIARTLHGHPLHAHTKLSDLVSQRRFEDLLDHALALKSIRRRLIGELIASPLYESIASDLLYNGIRDYLARSSLPDGIPGARSALKFGRAVVKRATAGFEDVMEDGLKKHIGRSLGSVSQKTAQPLLDGEHDDALRDVALDSWRRLRGLSIGELREDLSALDVEELFVTLYEFWKELRTTKFVGAMIDGGIDTFFDKYGAQSLAALLEDLGIDRALMLAEALRFGPHVLRQLHKAGALEPALRRGLEPFYLSGRIEQVLAKT